MEKSAKLSVSKTILSIFVIYILVNMVLFPQFYLQTTLNGISAWALNVLPCLLPFIFFTKILSSFSLTEKISLLFTKPVKKIYNTSPIASFAFISSVVSGYPLGAKVTADLYENKQISRSDAFKMMSFCSTSGPMFIIGAVGAGMFSNALIGYLIFSAHIIGAILNGIIYRNIKIKELSSTKKIENTAKPSNLSSMVLDTSLSVISVGTIIAIFFVVIASLSPILSFLPSNVSAFIAGLIEITKGCLDISALPSIKQAILLASFVISFGGISTIFQSLALTATFKMPIKLMILQKFTHALISTFIAFLLIVIFL